MKNRRARRSPVLLTAVVESAGRKISVKLRNLSEQGALIEADSLPPEGSSVVFERKELRCPSRVVWIQGRYAGIAFDAPLNTEQVLRHVPAPKPKTQSDFRRPGLACRPLSAYERRMLERWMTASPMGSLGE